LVTTVEIRVEKGTYIYQDRDFIYIHTVRVSLYKPVITYVRSDDVMAVPVNIHKL
jgi:hypothetical protein